MKRLTLTALLITLLVSPAAAQLYDFGTQNDAQLRNNRQSEDMARRQDQRYYELQARQDRHEQKQRWAQADADLSERGRERIRQERFFGQPEEWLYPY